MSLNPNAKPFSFSASAASFSPGGAAPAATTPSPAAQSTPVKSTPSSTDSTAVSWEDHASDSTTPASPNQQLTSAPTPAPTPAKPSESVPSSIVDQVADSVQDLILDEEDAAELRAAAEEDAKEAAAKAKSSSPAAAAASSSAASGSSATAAPSTAGGTGAGGRNQSSAAFHEKKSHDSREHINIVFIGHVDAGKSTISGQILLSTGQVDERTIQKYEKEAKEKNRESWYLAYILDTSEEERAKGKTVEVGRAHFQTSKKRYTLLDAPGHKNYVPNMIGGASQADVGVLVISARKAGFDRGGQTREHAMLAKTLGIQKLVILVNKMDDPGVKWAKTRYDEIEGKLSPFLKKCGFNMKTDVVYIPASGFTGVNIKEPATKGECDWYTLNKSLFQILDDFPPMARDDKAPLRLPIMARYKDMGALFCLGKLEAGTLVKDTNLMMMPNKVIVQCTGITVEETEVDAAKPGENVLVRIKGIEEEDVQEGFVLSYPDAPCKRSKYFECQLAVMDLLEHKPIIAMGYSAIFHVHVLAVECTITHLTSVIDKKTGEPGKSRPACLRPNDFATVRIKTEQSIAVEEFKQCAALGRFTLRDEGKTIAIGKITRIKEE